MFRIAMSGILRIAAVAFIAVLVHPIQAQSKTEKEAAVFKYQGKLLIAKKDGIAVGPFGKGGTVWEPTATPGAVNTINDAGVTQDPAIFPATPATALVRKGEVLKITLRTMVHAPRCDFCGCRSVREYRKRCICESGKGWHVVCRG